MLRQYNIKIHNIWQYILWEKKSIKGVYTVTQRYCIWSLGLRRTENESRVKVQSEYNVDKATRDIYISTERILCEKKLWLKEEEEKKQKCCEELFLYWISISTRECWYLVLLSWFLVKLLQKFTTTFTQA